MPSAYKSQTFERKKLWAILNLALGSDIAVAQVLLIKRNSIHPFLKVFLRVKESLH